MKKIIISVTLSMFFFVHSFVYADELKELFEKGAQLYQEGDYNKAIEYLEKAVKLDPNFAKAYNVLGLAYREINTDLREVAWYFKTATEIDPNYAEAYDNLGKSYYGMGQFDKAEEYCKKALSINPNLGSAQFSLAWIYLLGKPQPSDAIYYFKKVLERTKIPNAYFGLGMAYFMIDERPMVLEVITALRGINEEKLAEQLENILRDYYYVPEEGGGSLVKIKPPQEDKESLPLERRIPQEGKEAIHDLGGYITRVRMRGKFVNLDEKNQGNASLQGSTFSSKTQSSATRTNSSIITAQPPSLSSSGSSTQIKRTIEIQGSLKGSAKDSGY